MRSGSGEGWGDGGVVQKRLYQVHALGVAAGLPIATLHARRFAVIADE